MANRKRRTRNPHLLKTTLAALLAGALHTLPAHHAHAHHTATERAARHAGFAALANRHWNECTRRLLGLLHTEPAKRRLAPGDYAAAAYFGAACARHAGHGLLAQRTAAWLRTHHPDSVYAIVLRARTRLSRFVPVDSQRGWRHLVEAVSVAESARNDHAVSSANARGRMQVLPATAKEELQRHGMAHTATDVLRCLHERQCNTFIGARYLARQIEESGCIVLGLARYQAGPARVERWLEGLPGPPPAHVLLRIEALPSPTTRTYVRRVLQIFWTARMAAAERDPALEAAIHSTLPTRL